MYSKEETLRLKKEFWTSFAEYNPRKWILYDTKIKDVTFKFFVDNKKAQVLLDIEPKEDELRKIYFEKIVALETILKQDYLPEVILEKDFYLPNGKLISRAWVSLEGVNLNNRANWSTIFDFFSENMTKWEEFYEEHSDYIQDLEWNT
ncbi:MAG: hypothetical protein ACI9XR_001463 [Flavobacterium sp.]|jgi:hypothetical protein